MINTNITQVIPTNFEEWSMKWLDIYKKPTVSENSYRFTYCNTVKKHLIPYFKDYCLSDIKNLDIQEFLITKSNYSETMIEKMILCLRGIFDTAIDNDLCFKNPARKVTYSSESVKHKKQIYTSNQMATIKNLSYGIMNEVIILLETGLRRGELLGLQWSDIDLSNNVLEVNRSVAVSKAFGGVKINPPKWDSFRTIPLQRKSINIFRNMLKNNQYVFSCDGKIQRPNTWSVKLAKFMQDLPIDIPRLTAHELRHTYGTNLRRECIDIYTIQKVMGHKDINMTAELYVHNEVDELKRSMQNILNR